MKTSPVPGATGSATIRVDAARTIDFMGEGARVYATPMPARDMEMATRQLLLGHLDVGEGSLGTRLELDPLAAICRAKHRRFVVDVAATKQCLATKAQKARL